MKHYEIMFMVNPDQGDQVSAMTERYSQQIKEAKGVIHRLEDLGRRKLAYPINKIRKAHYVLMNIECDPPTLEKLETGFKYNDAVLRNMTIRRKEALTEPSPLMAEKSSDD